MLYCLSFLVRLWRFWVLFVTHIPFQDSETSTLNHKSNILYWKKFPGPGRTLVQVSCCFWFLWASSRSTRDDCLVLFLYAHYFYDAESCIRHTSTDISDLGEIGRSSPGVYYGILLWVCLDKWLLLNVRHFWILWYSYASILKTFSIAYETKILNIVTWTALALSWMNHRSGLFPCLFFFCLCNDDYFDCNVC